jgi:hypothetical protein
MPLMPVRDGSGLSPMVAPRSLAYGPGMTVAVTTERPPTPAPAVTPAENAVTVVVSTWLMVGLFIDGWAHNTRSSLETFFTPWHAVFYSGFTACAAWTAVLIARRLDGRPLSRARIPAGYGLAVVGIGVFAVGGAGDMTWHLLLGIETDVDALFSPTHLLLFCGIMLILTAPIRAIRRAGWPAARRPIDAAQVTLTLATALVLFFVQYLSMFNETPEGLSRAKGRIFLTGETTSSALIEDYLEVHLLYGIVTLLVSALVVTAPLVWLARERGLRPGAVTFHITVLAVFLNATGGFEDAALILAGLLAAVAGEVAVAWLRPAPGRVAARHAFATLLPVMLLASHAAVVATTEGIGWEAEFWTGTIVLAGLGGLALSLLGEPRVSGGVPSAA